MDEIPGENWTLLKLSVALIANHYSSQDDQLSDNDEFNPHLHFPQLFMFSCKIQVSSKLVTLF